MVLVIDNYDSFTYNLVQYLGEMTDVTVARNDRITFEEISLMEPDAIVISPGPGRPEDAGISNSLIKEFRGIIPILGVCLGHQCIGQVSGASIIHAENLYHGKVSKIYQKGKDKFGIFNNIKVPFTATRYHSLIIKKDSLPDVFNIIAVTKNDQIMAIAHKNYPLIGLQFHPESILTENGRQILNNFINLKRSGLSV